jgi:hypothetical protein
MAFARISRVLGQAFRRFLLEIHMGMSIDTEDKPSYAKAKAFLNIWVNRDLPLTGRFKLGAIAYKGQTASDRAIMKRFTEGGQAAILELLKEGKLAMDFQMADDPNRPGIDVGF